jgi:hypothetical protein
MMDSLCYALASVPTGSSDPQIILAAAGVIVAVLYTVVTGFIWHATWQNTKITQMMLEAAHRPYISIAEFQFAGRHMGDTRLGFVISNVGSVPAGRIKVDLEIQTPDSVRKLPRGTSATLALFPGRAYPIAVELSGEESKYMNSVSGELRVNVVVEYQGVYKKQYRTRCSAAHHGADDGFVLVASDFE